MASIREPSRIISDTSRSPIRCATPG
jgi:hypothetical protein